MSMTKFEKRLVIFALIFVVIYLGAAVVTINTRLNKEDRIERLEFTLRDPFAQFGRRRGASEEITQFRRKTIARLDVFRVEKQERRRHQHGDDAFLRAEIEAAAEEKKKKK